DCMKGLLESGLADTVLEVMRDRPFLGICLGLQMLFDASEEGPTACLGAIPGRVVRFQDETMVTSAGERLKVPHMGWSPVRQTRAHPLWAGIEGGSRFYFAHSYHPVPDDPDLTAGTAGYPTPFTCPGAAANYFLYHITHGKTHARGLISSLPNSIRKKVSARDSSCSPISSRGTAVPDCSFPLPLFLNATSSSPKVTAAPKRCRHANHSRNRHQGRSLRSPQARRHAV